MSQILIIKEKGEVLHHLINNIEEALGLTVIVKKDETEATNLLTIIPDISLIVYYPTSEKQQYEFMHYWNQMELRPQLIVISYKKEFTNLQSEFYPHHCLKEDQHWLLIVKMIADIFHVNLYKIADNLIKNYSAIASYDLYLFTHAPFPIYYQKDLAYQLYVQQGEEINFEKIKKDVEGGMRNLYLKDEDLIPFLNIMLERFDHSIDASALSPKELVFSAREMHLQAINVLTALGNNTTFSDLVENSINTIVHAWIKKHRLSRLLNMVMHSEGTLLFQHFSITAILSCEMERLRKGSIDPSTIEKLTYAAFLHDISISYNFFLTQITSEKLLKNAHISHYDYQRVLSHAKDSAELAKGLDVPDGVQEIILHHHGSADGIGFNTHFAPLISPLAHILSIAEIFSFSLLHEQYNSTREVNVTKIIKELSLQFSGTPSAAYLHLLKGIFVREKYEVETLDETGQHYFNF